jgi:sugar phosphate isomerase/epimerase
VTATFTDPRLVLAWGTIKPAAFPDRVAAAAASGFSAIGMAIPDYLALTAAGWTDTELLRVLSDHGMRIDELEVLFGFAGPPGPAGVPDRPGLVYADPAIEAAAWRMADVFGPSHVQAVGTFASGPPGPEVVSAFAALCDRAAPHGVKVALEFVPYTDIPDVTTAAGVVSGAGRPNGGLCVDSWHFFRGSAAVSDLRAVDPAAILMIQLNDGPAVPDTANRAADAVHHRRCPGDGDFDLATFLAAMVGPELAASISVEIYSDSLWRQTSEQAARRAGETTRSLLHSLISR